MNRIPVVNDDWTNPGFLFPLVQSRTPDFTPATPLYLFQLTTDQQIRSFSIDREADLFNVKRPMGVNTISKLFTDLCKDAGVDGHKTPHMMRAFVATKLANDPTVSSAEVQAALCHTSVVSQQAYIVPTVASEISRVKALGVDVETLH